MASISSTFNISITQGFFEQLFPETISYGSSGGPGWNTSVIQTDSGSEERQARWSEARRRYNASFGIRSQDDLETIREFYMVQQGSFGEFRFKDWAEYASTPNGITNKDTGNIPSPTDEEIGVGDASGTEFQLIRTYTVGTKTQARNIYKPRSGTVIIALDGVEQTSGFSVDTTTGIVLFTIPPGTGVQITAGFEFDVPCRFDDGADTQLNITIEAFEAGSLSVPLIEIRNNQTLQSDFFYGGGSDQTISADVTISLASGRTLRFNSGAVENLEIILPLTDELEAGGPYFYITNSGVNLLRLVPSQGIGSGFELANLSQDDTVIVLLADDGSTKTWYAI